MSPGRDLIGPFRRSAMTLAAGTGGAIRDELLSIERLEERAEVLARQPVNQAGGGDERVLTRARDNARALLRDYRELAAAIEEERVATPAAEWLVDNFHVVEDAVSEVRIDLPPGFYRCLPALTAGPQRGAPRVFGLAWAFVAHTDSRFEPAALRRFLLAFQRVGPLRIGELWAVPIALRMTLLENLRGLAQQIVEGRAARRQADGLADALLGRGQEPADPRAFRSREREALSPAFAVRLAMRLRGEDPAATPAVRWLEERLGAAGTTAEALVRADEHWQAAASVTVRNVITSLRVMSTFDWRAFVEGVSAVDEILRAGSAFAAMDFATRDRYRHAIEDLARGSGRSETDVARRTLSLAAASGGGSEAGSDGTGRGGVPVRGEPGYYLIARGRCRLEEDIGYRVSLRQRLVRAYVSSAALGYLGMIAIGSAFLVSLPLIRTHEAGVAPGLVALLALLALVPASDLASALVNRAVLGIFPPRALPRLELARGVPPELRTLVVVPTLLTSVAQIAEQVGRLGIHYLANADGDLRFALLSDWMDAASEHTPDDERLLAAAAAEIAALNRKHGPAPGGEPRFLLLHRRRVWSASEGCFMGWERKRGKLSELNRLLRGARDTTFVPAAGEAVQVPAGVRYVITLDADTQLPRGAAARLVGTMAHPLNRPRLDGTLRRVVEGYGVLQPRIAPTLPTTREGSRFQRVSSGPAGIDPYAAAVSDVYQDLFGEGSYTGKGIYDVDAFEAALAGRVPESALLSHDLFEGLFARAGLVTDIELFEEFPTHYEVAAARQHRWARGDWQLLPWMFRRGVPALGRWKMIDNLRRSLSAPAAYVTLVVGFALPGDLSLVWTRFVLLAIALPALVSVSTDVLPRRPGGFKRAYAVVLGQSLAQAASQVGLAVTLLTHQAWLIADAIGRTLVRLAFTRRNMLEWVTAAQASARTSRSLVEIYGRMWGAVLLALAAAIVMALAPAPPTGTGAALVALWLASPALAWWASRPARLRRQIPLSREDADVLRAAARRSWRFFETFVGPEDNALPPDNFQEEPKPVVAHRTSPTNLGLYLLSTTAARDLGWIGTLDMADRLEATLATMSRLERYRGHYYNWYDTRDLRPLDPRYVSSVDSGNLAGHLLVLAAAAREMRSRPLVDPESARGIDDALMVLREIAVGSGGEAPGAADRLVAAVDAARATLRDRPGVTVEWAVRLGALSDAAEALVALAHDVRTAGDEGEAVDWARAVRSSIASHQRDLDELAPWAIGAEPVGRLVAVSGGAAPALGLLAGTPALADLPALASAAARELPALGGTACGADLAPLREAEAALARGQAAAAALDKRLQAIAGAARAIFSEMGFRFLFDETRELLSIGYRVDDGALDTGRYDLLASEARLASFVAIARGDVPASHWFRLGRPMTPVELGTALVSWGGSMFEYLMPALVMRSPEGGLLDQTYRLVVRRQISYGAEHGVPWGISESGYNVRDLEMTYQYSSFGVPGLGLERGLGEDLVVTPYATGLAAMVDAPAAARNLAALAAAGARGRYGFYEALDYTRSRLPARARSAVIRAFMAHHQGMTLIALANVLQGGLMRARFHAEPIVQATELLLQERVPRDVPVTRPRVEEVQAPGHAREAAASAGRCFTGAADPIPRTHLLSNGRYVVMLTAAGSGFSQCGDLAVTRWREDVTRDCWGTFVFLRDVASGQVWSAGYQPTGVSPDSYEVAFLEDRAEIHRRDGSLVTRLEVLVSPEDDAEIRRVSLTNHGSRERAIELTSYAELVLAPPRADAAHPAFSNLFVQTEAVPELDTLLATRRVRSGDEERVWVAHVVAVDGSSSGGAAQYETDRGRFLGRGRGIRTPTSVIEGRPLSNTAGPVLDPILSLRRRVRLGPGQSARVVFATALAGTRAGALALGDKYRDLATFERTATLAWTQAHVQLHHLGIQPAEAHLFQDVANRVLYADGRVRGTASDLRRNALGPPALWAHRISGDAPIVLVRIDEVEDRGMVRQLLRAHEYWRLKGLAVDLVILNDRPPSYRQALQSALEGLVRAGTSPRAGSDAASRGRVFVLRADALSAGERDALHAAARIVLPSDRGTLAEQMARADGAESTPPPAPRGAPRREDEPEAAPARPALEFDNGLGGFVEGGREYAIALGEGQWTPAPWVNVVANERFGFQVSESGSGYTWALNSRENQLTPWSNDAVSDPPGEVVYVRDDESGVLWGPTLLPIREEVSPYFCRHGQGYTEFTHAAHGVALALTQYVPLDDPVKISRLHIENRSGRVRRLTVTAYAEWVLGPSRSTTAPFVVTELDEATGALLARNAWTIDFPGRVAFLDLAGRQTAWTGDRTEVLGRNGTLDHPDALERGARLSGRIGPGLDPCGALQVALDVPAGGAAELVVLLGQGATLDEARALVTRYRAADLDAVLHAVITRWDDLLAAVQVRTPDRSLDLLTNRWLLYQALACRVWARCGFYQAGGAYGFRDQLQDVMALAVADRDLARRHLCRAAARQFAEGDVQHWWHPPSGRGVRTRISDDLLWLPYAAAHYLAVTGDRAVLDEDIAFIEGPALAPGQAEAYFEPAVSAGRAPLFEHCARALDLRLAVGPHGLPLIGTGDWNDGMNRVGPDGRGESVWLGWFLHAVLSAWAPIAEARGESGRAAAWRRHAAALRDALDAGGWDGDWYRRAYFDDGTPLGSAENAECRIDSIAQSWAVLSDAADPGRAARAMSAIEEYLVRRDQALVLLFTPPFSRPARDPGYIKGYPPGVRENGGQYTHAAIWAVMAFASLGDGDRAGELFSILNPINHTSTRAGVYRYRGEPYVMAADVYSEPPHVGRAGWTWYTGSAGWMYRAAIEWLLGFRLRGAVLHIDPCIPRAWPGFSVTLRYHASRYEISVENPHAATRGVALVELDGAAVEAEPVGVPLVDDGALHRVRVVLGAGPRATPPPRRPGAA
jgi:cyclic beta-1,2-glucan synthetase